MKASFTLNPRDFAACFNPSKGNSNAPKWYVVPRSDHTGLSAASGTATARVIESTVERIVSSEPVGSLIAWRIICPPARSKPSALPLIRWRLSSRLALAISRVPTSSPSGTSGVGGSSGFGSDPSSNNDSAMITVA